MKTLVVLTALGLLSLLSEVFNFKKLLMPLVILGLCAAVVASGLDWQVTTDISMFKNMIKFDNYAMAFSGVMCFTTLLWFLMSYNYLNASGTGLTDRVSLIIFALTGAVLMVSYSNLSMFFLGLEILSIPIYVMASSDKNSLTSNEAGIKYFLMGAFATGIMLFGIALIYGVTASFSLDGIAAYITNGGAISGILVTGILFVLVGLSFKISAVPFHFWAPDVYTGAPTPVTAFMATIVKTAAFAAFLKLFMVFIPVKDNWESALWGMTILTLLVGNITAVYQQNAKRMLAYSSIAHAGYMMLGLLAMNSLSPKAILYYTLAYSVATIAAFTVLSLVENQKGNTDVDSFNGLAKSNKLAAVVMAAALLSMAGIPPLAGFFGKYFIFSSALQNGYVWPVIIAVIGSLISIYYYFRIIIAMYFKTTGNEEALELSFTTKLVLILCITLMLVLSVCAEEVLRWV